MLLKEHGKSTPMAKTVSPITSSGIPNIQANLRAHHTMVYAIRANHTSTEMKEATNQLCHRFCIASTKIGENNHALRTSGIVIEYRTARGNLTI